MVIIRPMVVEAELSDFCTAWKYDLNWWFLGSALASKGLSNAQTIYPTVNTGACLRILVMVSMTVSLLQLLIV